MKCPCEVIRDLLALYLDDVCSKESRMLVEEHLADCTECRAYFAAMQQEEEHPEPVQDAESEWRKASSLRAVKRKVIHKQLFAAAAVVLLFAVVSAVGIGILKNTTRIVSDTKTLAVSMVDGSLVGRIYGSEYESVKIKRISVGEQAQKKEYLFYSVADTLWDAWVTAPGMLSEYMLCPKEKDAQSITAVYYYTGDVTGLENKTAEQLEKEILPHAVLLWEKDTNPIP